MTKSNGKKLPKPDIKKLVCAKRSLTFNGQVFEQKRLLFSFSAFDRQHELFNLSDNNEDTTVGGKWFIELLDCLKSVGNKTISELMNKGRIQTG